MVDMALFMEGKALFMEGKDSNIVAASMVIIRTTTGTIIMRHIIIPLTIIPILIIIHNITRKHTTTHTILIPILTMTITMIRITIDHFISCA